MENSNSSVAERIAQAAVAFQQQRTGHEPQADEASEFAESIINTVREPLISLDQDLRVVTASRSFYEVFKVNHEETVGQLIYDLGNKQWDIPKLRELLELHEAGEEIERRTPTIARIQSSHLLAHILDSMRQKVEAKPVAGALTNPSDRLLILVGHDTNLSNIAGALGLDWIEDGRRNDTPPGGALVFELWKKHDVDEYSVRVFYTAQTLDQMRNATPLSLQTPPQCVPVFMPACSRADSSCPWKAFQQAAHLRPNPNSVQ